jgi:hypothetical protein
LLIYDNAESPEQIAALLPPAGGGHVLITSRWTAWQRHAQPVPLGVWSREESLAFLQQRAESGGNAKLDELAEVLGDLPLALDEAAAYLEQTGEDVAGYVQLVKQRFAELFGVAALSSAERSADTDQRRVAAVWSVALQRLAGRAPAGVALLTLGAFLAADIPWVCLPSTPSCFPTSCRTPWPTGCAGHWPRSEAFPSLMSPAAF